MRVLIVKMSALGDIIHALPVLDYLQHVSPGITIDWVVEEQFHEILAGNPRISTLHLARTKAWRKRPLAPETRHEISALKHSLREHSYEIVFDIQGNLKSGAIDWLSGSRNCLGFDKEVLQERLNLLFTSRKVRIQPQDYHVTDQYLRLVSAPFERDFTAMELTSDIHTSPGDDAAAESLLTPLKTGLVFLFHYGTTWQTKFWHETAWVALGKRILSRYPGSSILFSWGNENEKRIVSNLADEIGNGAIVIERYPLKGLTALLKKVNLVVGGDTGPVHLAAAVGTPTVSFYRASDGKRSGPRGNRHVIIQAPLNCTACFRTKCDRDSACRDSITVQHVTEGIEKLVSTVICPA